MPIKAFLAEVEAHLKQGNATEHTYRAALEKLFNAMLAPAKATNEPKHAAYGAPDFIIQQGNTPIGHAEAKDIGVAMDAVIADSQRETPRTDNGKQLRRYRAALPNLLYTDGLEWHWFVGGEARIDQPLRIATWDRSKKKLNVSATATADLTALLQRFGAQKAATVGTPIDLARRLAQIARWLHDVIVQVFQGQDDKGDLHQQLEAFRKTLLPTLTPEEFADMYAQTIVYGLFAARVTFPAQATFTRMDAAGAIPKTNPFLRKLFQEIAGYDLDDRVAWLVDDCANLLEHTDMEAVLRDFGKATRQEDPVVHFYETFLAAYDPKLRESRGVYYTPEPVVSYIVRSVDVLLKRHFNKPMGLADEKTIILDPATGTATFLHTVVQHIHATLIEQGMAGSWNSYVAEKLLPRVFGFELLMAPYTVAHLKMGLLLRQLGYNFASNERLGIYLTNTLADAPTGQQALAFAEYIAAEGQAANKVKHDKPVMVVLGNPPYSGHSANQGKWIEGMLKGKLPDGTLLSSYYEVDGQPLGERNSKWLQDDYVKFIRFAQWRINRTGEGILAFISNNGYLDNPTFRGMRQSLLHEFDAIYILNLHGNSKKKERAPDGSPDENVFDIQQGVAIGLFIKYSHSSVGTASVSYADLWGDRESKYAALAEQDVRGVPWQQLSPTKPWHLLVPQAPDLRAEYEQGWSVTHIMAVHGWGIATRKDYLLVDFERDTLVNRFKDIRRLSVSEAMAMYGIKQSPHWNFAEAKKQLSQDTDAQVRPVLFRPFDVRFVYYERHMIERGDHRFDLMSHMFQPNVSLISVRRTEVLEPPKHFYCTDHISVLHSTSAKEGNFVFPLYLYPAIRDGKHSRQVGLFDNDDRTVDNRRPNLSPAFIADVEQRLGLRFVPDGRGDLTETIGPEDIFHYTYAVFHSPTYRTRYAEFLKIDFPRLPITSDVALFASLAAKGAELVDLHLLRLPGDAGVGGNGGAAVLVSPGKQGVSFPKPGNGVVDKIAYVAPQGSQAGRVVINNDQFFDGIDPETWEMQIGGYQPLEKWLKDRKGRALSFDDLQHYTRMIIALRETRRIMAEIDEVIPGWPLA